jgi:hypothetical protein
MVSKIGLFVVFIVAVEVWLGASNLLSNIPYILVKDEARRRNRFYTILFVQLIVLLQWMAFYLFIFILSGFFDPVLFLVSVLSSEIAIILGSVLRTMVSRAQEQRAKSSAMSAGAEFELSHSRLVVMHGYARYSLGMLYELACGLIYFLSNRNQLPTRMFQATTIFFLLLYISAAAIKIPIIASKGLDDRTRNRLLVTQIADLLPMFLLFAIAFWAFGVGGNGATFGSGKTRITVSSGLIVAYAIIAFIIVILPYVYGAWRSSRLRTTIAKAKVRWYQRATRAVLPPTASLYDERLRSLQSSIADEIDDLIRANRVLLLHSLQSQDGLTTQDFDDGLTGSELSLLSSRAARAQENSQMMQFYLTALNRRAPSPKGISQEKRQAIIEAWEDALEVDPRFQYLYWLRQLKSDLKDTASNICSRHNNLERESAASTWSIFYRDHKYQLEREVNEPSHSTAPIVAACGTIVTTGLGVVMDMSGKWIWQTFASGLLK